MASTPFYEDRGVGAVDVDCGADLDSDINGVASFIQWTERPLEQLVNASDKRVPRNISVFGSWKTYDLTDMWYDSLGSNPTSFEILLDLYLSFKVVLLFFFGSSLVEAFVAWSWSWTALHSVLYYSWPCSYMICSQISQILHIIPYISNIA